jgi:CDP-diacylglycerol--glycerol-3-phosphate 3-phosphatidyltransferase
VNLPNQITLARFFGAALLFVVLAMLPPPADPTRACWGLVALLLFVLVAASDFLDGWLARHLKQLTVFGRMADAFVDKVMICGALTFLCALPETRDWVPPWSVVVVITREFMVTGIRGIVEAQGKPFPADRLGKLKLVAQAIAVGAFLGLLAGWTWTRDIGVISYWLSVGLTLLSGCNYVWKARAVFTV